MRLKIALILTLCLILAACSDGGTPVSDTNSGVIVSTSVADAPSDAQMGDVVARVNGTPITRDDFIRELQRSPAASTAASRTDLEIQVLDTLIEQQLINQGAQAMNITVTDEDVANEIAELKDLAGSDDNWQDYLGSIGFTEVEMTDAQYDTLITQRVRDMLLADYMGEVEQVQARHIVVQTLPEAEEVLRRLADGEGFATLAAEFSRDRTTQEVGGNLGWFARNELFYQTLEDAAFSLEVGEMAGPIATALGYHIIQTMDKAVLPVEADRLPMLSENIFSSWLDEQHRNANIERMIEW